MMALLTLAMSKIWAAVSVQCQAFLMKNEFLDSCFWLKKISFKDFRAISVQNGSAVLASSYVISHEKSTI